MATTHIHAITATVESAIAYGANDKIEEKLKDDISDSINYARNDKTGEVTYKTYTTTLNCPHGDSDVAGDFYALIDKYRFLQKRDYESEGKKVPLAWHLVQSFDGYIPPQLANEIGVETAKAIFGNKFRVQISTHTNTENIHNHIIFCAWDIDGRKWNGCNDTYKLIRETSDRICKEYGLEILEGTKNQKLVKWYDKDGKVHFYEPTDRKNRMIEERNAGRKSTDDVGSYRNAEAYEDFMYRTENKRDIVRHDIDMMLPYAKSYEHLLELLREHLGYEIRDKKADGEWLAHISFKPPTGEKFIRDKSLSDDGFYERESLEKIIREENRVNHEGHGDDGMAGMRFEDRKEEEKRNIPVTYSYTYSKANVKSLDENVRAVINPDNGDKEYVKRGEPERTVVRDIKKKDFDLYDALQKFGYDTSAIDDMIKRQEERANLSKWQLKKEQEEYVERMTQQIQDRLNVLRFVEKNSLLTYSQMNAVIRAMWEKYNQCFSQMNEAENMISQLERLLKLPQYLESVRERMKLNANNSDYMNNEYGADKKSEYSYLAVMKKYGVETSEQIEELKVKIASYKERAESLNEAMQSYKKRLVECESCMEILRECDRANEYGFEREWLNYEAIESAGRDVEQKNENERKHRQRLER